VSFERQAFISYAHIDDQPLPEEEHGWVGRFHAYLENFLSQTLGERANIWRDERLTGNDDFADEIEIQLDDVAVLVSIVSPRYLKSEWCNREVDAFCRAANEHLGLEVGNRSRLFKVMRFPVPPDEQPEAMRSTLGYEFFLMDGERPLPLDPALGPEAAQTYRRRILLMAHDIAEMVKALAEGTAKPAADATTVYLAECSYDRREDRELLASELRAEGITVVPRRPLPSVEADYVVAVKRLLAEADLSIHLIGASRGVVPDGPGQDPVPVIQNRIAAALSAEEGLPRVLSVPRGLTGHDAAHQQWIDALHSDATLQQGADLVTGDLEELKGAVHGTLERLRSAPPEIEPDASGELATAPLVWLICDRSDRQATLPLIKHLRAQGLQVKLPAFTGSASDLRAANEALAAACDSVLLYWGEGDEAWRVHQESNLRKQIGRRDRPLKAMATWVAAPDSDDKDFAIVSEEPGLIDGRGDFDPSLLATFLAEHHDG